MGAFGYGNFENDDALDFIGEFEDSEQSVALLEMKLKQVVEMPSAEYLEAPLAAEALAAAEILAALSGKPSSDFPNESISLTAKVPVEQLGRLKQQGLKAVGRIESNSELKELWEEEASEGGAWRSVLQDLKARLA